MPRQAGDGGAFKLSDGAGSAEQCDDGSGGGGPSAGSPKGGGGGGAGASADNKPSGSSVCVGGVCTTEGNCFVAGTLVETEAGALPIESITPGTRVWSRDQHGDAVDWKPVLRTFAHETHELLALTIGGPDDAETILVTPNHIVYAKERGWIAAGDLVPGRDRLVDRASREAPVVAATSIAADVTVYNFEVADYHTYFVGRHSLWVHNTCPHDNDFHCTYCGDDPTGNLTGPVNNNNPSGDRYNCFNCAIGEDYTSRTGIPTRARPNLWGEQHPTPYTLGQSGDRDYLRGPYAPPPRSFSGNNSGSATENMARYIESRPYSQGIVSLDYGGFGGHEVNARGGGGRPAEIYDPQIGAGVGRTIDIDSATYYETNYASRRPPSSRVSYQPPSRGSVPRITTGLGRLSLDDPPPRRPPRPGEGYRITRRPPPPRSGMRWSESRGRWVDR